jgi:hypothetical protein
MSRAKLGTIACPEKPAMNNPKAVPVFAKSIPFNKYVSHGSDSDPGECDLLTPSNNSTKMMSTVDKIPITEV